MSFNSCCTFPSLCWQGSPKTDIFCDSMSTTKGSLPDHPFPYSDHEALTTELRLESSTSAKAAGDQKSKDQNSTAGSLTGHVSHRCL